VGYFTGADYRQQGYTKEGLWLLLNYLFQVVGLNKVRADTGAFNQASIAHRRIRTRLERTGRDAWCCCKGYLPPHNFTVTTKKLSTMVVGVACALCLDHSCGVSHLPIHLSQFPQIIPLSSKLKLNIPSKIWIDNYASKNTPGNQHLNCYYLHNITYSLSNK
jgi:hypothetical protein